MWHGGCPRGPPEAMVTVVCGPAWCGGHWGPLIVVVPVHKYKKSFSKREKRQQKEEKKYITCQWGSFWAPFDLVVQVVLVTVHRHRSGSRRHASQTHLSCVNQWTKFRPMVARLSCCVVWVVHRGRAYCMSMWCMWWGMTCRRVREFFDRNNPTEIQHLNNSKRKARANEKCTDQLKMHGPYLKCTGHIKMHPY